MPDPTVDPPVIDPPVDPPIVDPPVDPPPGDDDWRSSLPDDLKTEASLGSFKDVSGLAKSYVEAQKMIGGSVRIPKDDATPEEIEAFHVKLGRPEKVEDYGFVKPEMPEGVQLDEALFEWFGKTAHGIGLSKTQANKLMQAWNDNTFTQTHEAQKTMKTEIDGLRESWGDQFDGRVELGLRGVERLLPAEEAGQFKTLMDSTGLGNNPIMLKYAFQVGKMLKEDGYIMGDGHGGVHGVESAKAKIEEINASIGTDHEHSSWKGDKAGVEEMKALHKIAFPA